MHAGQVMTCNLAGQIETVVEVAGLPSGLGWLPDGQLLIVSMKDRRVLRYDGQRLQEHADLADLAGCDCNDMVVDALGRAYVGHFGFDVNEGRPFAHAELILVSPEGEPSVVARELKFPNGSVITDGGRTLVVCETFASRLSAFDIAADGSLGPRRDWAVVTGTAPDGCCLDAEGAIWFASPLSREVVRVREGGEVCARIDLGRMGIACQLGGPEGRHLFILSSGSTLPAMCVEKRDARIEVCEVDVPGAGSP